MKLRKLFLTLTASVLMAASVYAADPSLSIVSDYDLYPNSGLGISYGENSNDYEDFEDPPVILFVNGDAVSEGKAIIENGTTLVPLRVISNRLNASVDFDGSTKTAYISYGDTSIQAAVGNSYITVNGNIVSTSAPTQIIDSTTYVPLRVIASAFGADVGYNGDCFWLVKVVWVQSTEQAETVSASEAVDIAQDVFFNIFLPTEEQNLSPYGIDVNALTPENINEEFHSKFSGYVPEFICSYEADLGEYYYIKYYDCNNQGILIDKYDGSYYPVDHFSIGIIRIGGRNTYTNVWSPLFVG